MKKLTALLLALSMIFSVSTVGWATENLTEPTEAVTEEVISEPSDDEIVATLYLCSNITVWPIVGHSWIYVKNHSSEAIDVGYYNGVESGEGVSVGAFSFSVWDGWGIYYNLEAYRERNNDNYLYVSRDMTRSDLDKLNNALKSYPNYWGIIGNCATFSFSMWNAVTGSAYFSLLIPAITHFTVLLMGGKSGEQIMTSVDKSEIKRQSDGKLIDVKYTD